MPYTNAWLGYFLLGRTPELCSKAHLIYSNIVTEYIVGTPLALFAMYLGFEITIIIIIIIIIIIVIITIVIGLRF